MKNVYVYCEGKTEERFITNILAPYFYSDTLFIKPIICCTKKAQTGQILSRGGVSRYAKIKTELISLCYQHKNELVTMMFDYYQIPSDTPGKKDLICQSLYEKVVFIENEIKTDINQTNFLPNLILHEFEGLLFSDPSCFKSCINLSNRSFMQIKKVRDDHESPEHIDDSPITAPSKRIKCIIPNYMKTIDGIKIAETIGIEKIRQECKHFNAWLIQIEKQAK